MAENPLQRQQRLQQTKPEERVTPYQQLYGLRENPFPSLALFTQSANDPRRNGTIYDASFRQVEERQFFNMFVQPPTGDRRLELGFIRVDPQAGGRGNGKSAFLHHIMRRVNSQEWGDWPSRPDNPDLFSLAVHILPEPRRQKKFWQFICLIFETLANNPICQDITVQIKSAILLSLLTEEQISTLVKLPADDFRESLLSFDKFLQLLKDQGVTYEAFQEELGRQIRAISPIHVDEDFLELFTTTGGNLESLWIEIKKHSDYRWRNDGIGWFLNGLIPVLIVAGYKHIFVLLDEFEKIYIYQNSRERDEFLDALRQYFYERPSVAADRQYISTVLTVHPSIDRFLAVNWQRVGLDYLAPLKPGQIEQRSVTLGASTSDSLTRLLVTYLDYFRIKAEHKGTIFPFEAGALEPALNAARLYPRGALWYAHVIIQKAAGENINPPISRTFVEDFVQTGKKPPVEEEDTIFELPSSATDLQAPST